MTKTNGDILRGQANKIGMPLRTLEQVTADLARDKARAKGKNKDLDKTVARLMLDHGRLTDEARAYVQNYLGSK